MFRALRPLFVNVTWGAGGSTSLRSLELAEMCQRQLGLTTCLHMTCTNMSRKVLDQALDEVKNLGIRNILALRGDPPRGDEYREEGQSLDDGDEFVWAKDLVRYIRERYGTYFCIGVAGYPEGHSDESNPAHQDPRDDMPFLVEKVKAGADFILTQLFYDEDAFLAYEDLVRAWDGGVLREILIIPGLMPIQSFSTLKRTTHLSHARLPPEVSTRLEAVRGNDEEVKKVGVDIVCEMIEKIKRKKSPHPRGFHFYTLNLEKAVSFVVERCGLIPSNALDVEDDFMAIEDLNLPLTNGHSISMTEDLLAHRFSRRRESSVHNRVMTDESSSHSALEPQSRATTLEISHGVGTLGREATWDDYPNGRFGDARSPAFGEIDGYGTSLHLSPAAARMKWGYPESREDIGKLFDQHIRGALDQLPWSEGPLSPETARIQPQLCKLIEERGWWTIASQPAIDGLRSEDAIFGWGPRGGFVFQKAFVEFWIPANDWHDLLHPHLCSPDIAGEVSWYASPCPPASIGTPNQARTPLFQSSDSPTAVNTVTWGVFAQKEIISPTIIEGMSFRAWVEEAFGIWAEWERCYAPASPSRKVLRAMREELWLVNVIGHSYREEQRLWDILVEAKR